MPESRSHERASKNIARKYRTEYNRGQGPDIRTPKITVEVETEDTIGDAARQLQGHRGPVYVAVTNHRAVQKALDRYKDSTIGVMDNTGKIIKRSTRK